MAIPPVYLLATTGQVWQVGVTNSGLLTTTMVADVTASQFIPIKDLDTTHFWNLGVNTIGELTLTAITGACINALPIQAPDTTLWLLQVNAGLLQTTVSAATIAQFVVAPLSFNFIATEGTNPVSQTENVSSDQSPSTELPFLAISDQSWLIVNPPNGTTPTTLDVSVNVTGLAPGVYTGTIVITPSC